MSDLPTPILLALAITALPLAAFVIQIFFGRFLPRQGDFVPTLAMGAALVLALVLMKDVLFSATGMAHVEAEWTWIKVGVGGADLELKFGVLVDNLTVIMLFVVTLVSFLVHLYSTGYMHGEKRYNRFFAYLALFSFSMLGLCITNSLFFLFIFWELVGLNSYFLIGFYFEKDSAANACKKAFLTTRIGDLGFFIALMMILTVAGSFGFSEIFESVQQGKWAPGLLVAAAILLFFGPVGKSAQFPLHVWLPDAMEGPTPVSALIHAATMVAAGVYLVARMFPFFAGPGYFEGDFFHSEPLFVVAIVGAFTSIFAATIALAQTDIKKVLAYSTISQLGYMMLGIGVGSPEAGMFHLFTHAFFKACLFLGAGSVIHAVHSNEMKDMGGLRKKMPITFATFLISCAAIAGVPFLSGFYSKEAVLTQALAFGIDKGGFLNYLPFVLGILTAGLTPFYMFRVVFKTFCGEPKDHHKYDHAHESPMSMALPLMVLAGLAVISGGVMGWNAGWFEQRVATEVVFDRYLGIEKTLGSAAEHFEHAHHAAHWPTMGMSILMAAGGIFFSWLVFNGPLKDRDLVGQRGFLASYRRVLENLYYVDAFYNRFVIGSVMAFRLVLAFFDKWVVDGLVNLAAWITKVVAAIAGLVDYNGVDGAVRATGSGVLRAGQNLREMQTGRLHDYLFASVILIAVMFAGVALFL